MAAKPRPDIRAVTLAKAGIRATAKAAEDECRTHFLAPIRDLLADDLVVVLGGDNAPVPAARCVPAAVQGLLGGHEGVIVVSGSEPPWGGPWERNADACYRGQDDVDMWAPGGLQTTLGIADPTHYNECPASASGLAPLNSGNSLAIPYVAGVAALVVRVDPTLWRHGDVHGARRHLHARLPVLRGDHGSGRRRRSARAREHCACALRARSRVRGAHDGRPRRPPRRRRAEHVARTVQRIKHHSPRLLVETLVGDFQGVRSDVATLVREGRPDVFAHNVEVVPALQRKMRDARCSWQRSIDVLSWAKAEGAQVTKSSLMVGCGETPDDVREAMRGLRDAGVNVQLVIGEAEKYGFVGPFVIADEWPGKGPLGGLATALRYASNDHLLVIGCDLPALNARFFELLKANLGHLTDAVVPRHEGLIEPLAASYHRNAQPAFRRCVELDVLKMSDAVSQVRTSFVEVIPGHDGWPADLFRNINAPTDL